MATTCSVGGGRVEFELVCRIDPFRVEAMCYLQETHGVDMLQKYNSQGIAIHILIWDTRI